MDNTQVDPTPATEVQPEPTQATEPTPPDYSWLKDVPPETLEWMREKGVHGYKKWNQENMALKEKQAKLDAALSRLAEKPQPSDEISPDTSLNALKGRLQKLVDNGKLSLEEANAEYLEAKRELSFQQQQSKVLTEDKLDEVLSKREMEKQLRLAEKEIVKAANGRLDDDDAFAMLNGYISAGMDVDEAREKVLGFFSNISKEAKAEAKETVKKVLEPPATPKIVTPGVVPAPSTPSEPSLTDLAKRVIEQAKARAKRG